MGNGCSGHADGYLAASQSFSLRLNFPNYGFTTSAPQKDTPDFPLTTNADFTIYQATLQNNSIYFAFHATGPKDPSEEFGLVTAQSCYVVINVANAMVTETRAPLTAPGGANRPRFITGAFVEARGCLDVTSLGNYTNAFYPAMTADSAGLAGNLNRGLACMRVSGLFEKDSACMACMDFHTPTDKRLTSVAALRHATLDASGLLFSYLVM